MSASELLAAALTYREAAARTEALPGAFASTEDALGEWQRVLLHEAREALSTPLATLPESLYLHPVDVETDEPGIVDTRTGPHVMRRVARDVPRIDYGRAAPTAPAAPAAPGDVQTASAVPRAQAEREAAEALLAQQVQAEREAKAYERRRAKAEEAKEARKQEAPEEREARLEEQRRKRAERKAVKEAAMVEEPAPSSSKRKPAEAVEAAEAAAIPEVDPDATVRTPRKAVKKNAPHYYEHPLPHHRHLRALQQSAPGGHLVHALLHGEESDHLEIVQGPPGTGKTRALVQRLASLPDGWRALLCAPTNVGAANLYARLVAEGYEDDAALALAPERVPAGTAVLSSDPARRFVCATVSARAGPRLDAQRFEAVLADEAAQTMEAWTWTLLRAEVQLVVLAGDVRQLPAYASESGLALRHERSLMERLLDLGYGNTCTLSVQNRMAPEILAYPNAHCYDGALVCGPHAPAAGAVELVLVDDGAEEASGTSWCNRPEAAAAASAATAAKERGAECVLLAPYAAQCRALLSHATKCEVHTLDSFQGREAHTVVLSLVRDGRHGPGFWDDPRRLAVALTRARERLVLVASRALLDGPPNALRALVQHHGA